MNVFAARREPVRYDLSPTKVRAFTLFAPTFLPASSVLSFKHRYVPIHKPHILCVNNSTKDEVLSHIIGLVTNPVIHGKGKILHLS